MPRGRRPGETEYDVVAPDASAMIESLRAFGYDLPTAIADLIDNTRTIERLDPGFWRVYRVEKIRLLEVLRDGDATLWRRAAEQCSMPSGSPASS